MCDPTRKSDVDTNPTGFDFAESVAEMVADQAPRLFAVVLEYGYQLDAQIVAWGMALDEYAYMTAVDGRKQYLLAEPENAMRYVRGQTGITPHLVWASGERR